MNAIILGSGNVGLWIAATCAAAGLDVTIISRRAGADRERWSIEPAATGWIFPVSIVGPSAISEIVVTDYIFLAHDGTMIDTDVACLQGAAWFARSKTFSFANGLWDEHQAHPVVCNSAINAVCDRDLRRAVVTQVPVAASYVANENDGPEVAAILWAGGMPVEVVPPGVLEQMRQKKTTANAIVNGLSEITGLTMREIAESPDLVPVVERLLSEAGGVFRMAFDFCGFQAWCARGGSHMPSSSKRNRERRPLDQGVLAGDRPLINDAIVELGEKRNVDVRGHNLLKHLMVLGARMRPDQIGECFAAIGDSYAYAG